MRCYWDFFGPNAGPTAEHFVKHLDEFLAGHSIRAPTGTESAGDGHMAAWCEPPADRLDDVRKALKPRREVAAGDVSAAPADSTK